MGGALAYSSAADNNA